MDEPAVPAEPSLAPNEVKVQFWRPAAPVEVKVPVREIGGRKDGPEPTRYGDWEKNGRCIDF